MRRWPSSPLSGHCVRIDPGCLRHFVSKIVIPLKSWAGLAQSAKNSLTIQWVGVIDILFLLWKILWARWTLSLDLAHEAWIYVKAIDWYSLHVSFHSSILVRGTARRALYEMTTEVRILRCCHSLQMPSGHQELEEPQVKLHLVANTYWDFPCIEHWPGYQDQGYIKVWVASTLTAGCLLATHTKNNDLETIKSQKEERFPKSPCRAVCGDLSGNLWMPDREELVPHVKLSSNRGDKIKQKLWEGPTWLPGHPEYISLLGTK